MRDVKNASGHLLPHFLTLKATRFRTNMTSYGVWVCCVRMVTIALVNWPLHEKRQRENTLISRETRNSNKISLFEKHVFHSLERTQNATPQKRVLVNGFQKG